MRTVRFIANILFYLSRIAALIFLATSIYAVAVIIVAGNPPSPGMPISVHQNGFELYYPFTRTTFLIGEYSTGFIATNFLIMAFYGIFLWLLSNVFLAFRQSKLFTKKSVVRLSVFYIINLLTPLLFGSLVILFRSAAGDLSKIVFLHLVIGVFAFFMAAIFKQGVVLQEEQDLTF
jgi:hypothetical protein